MKTAQNPYRSRALPPEPDRWSAAWSRCWRSYATRRRAYAGTVLGTAAAWGTLRALGPEAPPWIVALAAAGPLVAPILGLWTTNFVCPRCGGLFTGSDFVGIPDGGALKFWLGIFPTSCRSCGIRARGSLPMPPASDGDTASQTRDAA
jgi:hypothetical protein